MASVSEMIINIRNLIGDTSTPSVYNDPKLREYLLGAGMPRTNVELGTAYISSDSATISPEPSGAQQYHMELSTAYAVVSRQYAENASKALKAKEGSSEIDLSNTSKESGAAAKALNDLIKDITEKIKREGTTGVYIV